MKEITLEALLEAGCHFGHQVTRHNPKSRDFVFEARDGIHIIDLAKTKEGLEEAGKFINSIAKRNGSIIIVGTKRQAQPIIAEELKRSIESIPVKMENGKEIAAGIFYVIKRWIGGTLTNFSEVEKNFKKLKDITARLRNDEEKMKYTKKEIGQWDKERVKLASFYDGIMNMKKQPDAVIIIDTHLEHLAVREARQMHVPIVGMVDTNSDPDLVDYPIPSNDDAVGSIKIILSYLMDAWIEGKNDGDKATEEIKEKKEKSKEETVEKPTEEKPKKKKISAKKETSVKKAKKEEK